MSIAHRLRHRVTIERKTAGADAWGQPVETWEAFASNVPAEVKPLSVRELIAAQAEQAGVTTKITMRHFSGVVPSMRISHEGVIYAIKGPPLQDPTMRRLMTILCEAGIRES